jgi:uncharacterized protein YodC (DUF2158 family)
MADWKVGDKVKLATGGPDMTVTMLLPGDLRQVICQWFKDGKLEKGNFSSDSLVQADT